MVEGYTILKTVHVLAAAALVGALLSDALLTRRARSADASGRAFVWGHIAGAEAVAIPLSFLLLFSGLLMVYGPWRGGWAIPADGWIVGGIIIWIAISAVMGGLGARAAKSLAQSGGADAVAVKRFTAAIAVTGVLAVIAVWLMVAKPM